MPSWIILLISVLYPLLTYVSAVTGKPALALVALGLFILPLVSRNLQRPSKFLFICFLLLYALSFLDARVQKEWPVLLYFPPVVMSGFILWLFGRTLYAGKEPIVTTFCRLARGELSEELLRYTRGLTWFWTIVLAAMTLNSILLAAFAPIRVWALFTNVINYLIVLAVFVIEYIFRILRFPNVSHTHPFGFISHLVKEGGWSSLAKEKSAPAFLQSKDE